MELALLLRKAPHEVDALPYLDSIQLLARHYKQTGQERRWQAALHSKRLR